MTALTRKTPALMVLGTGSHAGKSTLAAGFCRLLARRGLRVAPFKAQNMALNSHVTREGGEIGRAQAVQARAAGVEPHTDMNPVLLKPSGRGRMQVILNGKPQGICEAREYYGQNGEFRRLARQAYDRLAARFDAIVLEGAGSPAEINLREQDFVNVSMAEHAGARCVLAADIDRGGVFASILGTCRLLSREHRRLLDGIIINKFRGDKALLDPGLVEIRRLTGIRVLGVLPHLGDLGLEEEDSLGLEDRQAPGRARLDIAVIRLPHISNFTDFQPLEREPGVGVRYVDRAPEVGNPDLLVLPGSKNVRSDMRFLEDSGLARVVRAAAARQIPVLGICGGYQLLGETIEDPHGVEGEPGSSPGLALLPLKTRLETDKELARVEAESLEAFFCLPPGTPLSGYEIHMGITRALRPCPPLAERIRRNGAPMAGPCGHASGARPVFGLYLHGLFDPPWVRREWIHWLLRRKGLDREPPPFPSASSDPIDRLADALARHLELDLLLESMHLPWRK